MAVRRGWLARVRAGLGLAVLLLAGACHRGSPSIGTRAVVVGIDGADWKVIDALAVEGGMPNLARLRAQGVWGRIETLPDVALSPVIWTSVATGKLPSKHGVTWFLVDRPDGSRVPVRSYNRKTKALWNILAEANRTAAVVGWWATYPAEEIGDGVVVSDALGYHGFGRTAREDEARGKTHPPALLGRLAPLVPPQQAVSAEFAGRFIHMSPQEFDAAMFTPARYPAPDPANPIHLFQQYAVTAQGYTAIAEELLASRRDDLLLLYFEQVDSHSHLFMKYAAPRLPWIAEEEFARYRDIVAEWYRYQDELLGRILQRIDLDETAVFVLSDHGFKSGERRIRSEATVDIRRAHLDHETHGIFIAAGPHVRRGVEIEGASVLDVTPTLLAYLGLPVARDMDGKVLEQTFDPSFLREHPVRYAGSYEAEAAERVTEGREDFDEEELARTEKALRSLGYMGGGSEPVPGGGADDGSAERPAADAGGQSSPEIHNNLGRLHLREGRPDEARQEFERALALDPANADALLNLGSLERLEGRIGRAEHYVKRALQVNPNSVAAVCQLAELARDRDDLAQSIRLYGEALRIDDSQPFVFLGLGDSLQRAGRYAEAERAFRSVLELDPDSFEASYNLGVTYLNQGRLDEAQGWFDKALALSPTHPAAASAHNNLGDIWLRRGDRARAVAAFEQAVRASPRHLESRYNLAVQLLQDRKAKEAIPLLESAAALAPDHEQVAAALGMAYLLDGRNEDAYRSFLLVRRLYPRNWVAPLGLALLHAGAGDAAQARQLLDEALRLGGDAARAEAKSYPILAGLLGDPGRGK